MLMKRALGAGITAAALLYLPLAQAQIKVGIILSATGPAASLGIPQKNTATLLPKTIAGQSVDYIVLDDASDPTNAVKDMRKLITEDNVDLVIGSSVTPNSLAMVDVAAETKVPMISLAASAKIIQPVDDKRHWVFKTPQNDSLMAGAIADSMAANGIKTVGMIGFSDAYGQGWHDEFGKAAAAKNIKIVDYEEYSRADTSVTGQALKLMAANPDAILVAGSGTPAALPETTLKERGYTGKFYQTHGVANNDFLRVCGKDCNGTLLPSGPLLVAAQLPDSNPTKKVGLAYTEAYEKAFGVGTVATFGGHLWDAVILLENAAPTALKSAKPGTPQFRSALRDAIENLHEVPISHGVVNMTSADHSGLDSRGRVMVTIQDGKWVLVK